MRLFAILLFLAASVCSAAELKSGAIVLLQPDFDLQTKGFKVDDLAAYLKATEAAAAANLKPKKLDQSSGFIVFAVRQGNLTNAWVDFKPALPAEAEAQLIASVRKVPAFPVAHGTVVFAIKVMINGAAERPEPTPFPAAWRAAMSKQDRPLDIESVVTLVWP
jgi:hypothetical protein